jgi:hypothetical protein
MAWVVKIVFLKKFAPLIPLRLCMKPFSTGRKKSSPVKTGSLTEKHLKTSGLKNTFAGSTAEP